MKDAFHKTNSPCTLTSLSADFPDLRIQLETNEGPAGLKQCLDRARNTAVEARFAQSEFDRAIKESLRYYRPVSFESGDFTRADLVFTRLRVVGDQALRRLYASDPVFRPLFEMHEQLTAITSDYQGFLAWIDVQRNAGGLRWHGAAPRHAQLLQELGYAISKPSQRPVLGSINADRDGSVQLRAPNLKGKSFVVIRCRTEVDPTCDLTVARSVCRKSIDLIAHIIPSPLDPKSSFTCRSVSILGLSGWLAVETSDNRAVEWLAQLLRANPAAARLEPSLLDYVVLITTTN